ncbi:MAG: EAL domain-containing protein [Syntrophotaleaceae bacterium]
MQAVVQPLITQAAKARILVIDDEEPARMIMMDFLEDAGYQVLEAENGQQGIEMLQRENPDAVLTDIRMPVMDGLKVVEAMKNIAPLTPAIIVSGTGLMENVISALRLGAWDYILKPVQDLEILDHVVRKALEKAILLQSEKDYRQQLEKEVREKTSYLEAEIEARKLVQQQLEHEAHHDALTRLGNRRLCMSELGNLETGQGNNHFGFLLFDISGLRNLNDAYGYSLGDQLLIAVGKRLAEFSGENTKVFRMGSDEFAALLQGRDREEVVAFASAVEESIRRSYLLEKESFNVGFVFGLSLFSTQDTAWEKPVNEATFAHLQAKKNLCSQMVIYDDLLHQEHLRRLALEKEMPEALAKGEFFLAFQPILNQKTGKLFGFEGLLRWNSKQYGPISPGEFIPIAEECGFISELGEWALETGCRTWCEKGLCRENLTLSMNVSGKQFFQQALISRFKGIIERTGFDPTRLCIEITESVLMTNVVETTRILHQYKDLGVRISIDDFGTGYSSLEYLNRFPVDHLKIDMSFIHKMDRDPKTHELIKVMKNMASVFGLELVAEGVETAVQKEMLSQLGCHLHQGFFYSRPVPGDAISGFLMTP